MDHPDESMLLASTRQEPESWSEGIKQHIAQCSTCYERYRDCQRINKILVEWAHDPAYHTYPSITASVMQRVYEQESSSSTLRKFTKGASKGYRAAATPKLRSAGSYLAAGAAVLCTLLVFALATGYASLLGSIFGYLIASQSTATLRYHEAIYPEARLNPTHTPVVPTTGQQVTADETSMMKGSYMRCSPLTGAQHNHLSICRSYFPPGNSVALMITIEDKWGNMLSCEDRRSLIS